MPAPFDLRGKPSRNAPFLAWLEKGKVTTWSAATSTDTGNRSANHGHHQRGGRRLRQVAAGPEGLWHDPRNQRSKITDRGSNWNRSMSSGRTWSTCPSATSARPTVDPSCWGARSCGRGCLGDSKNNRNREPLRPAPVRGSDASRSDSGALGNEVVPLKTPMTASPALSCSTPAGNNPPPPGKIEQTKPTQYGQPEILMRAGLAASIMLAP